MSLLTRCTHCHTVFRITPEQLQAHGGKVRCGHCMQVFDGMIALAPDAPPVAAASATAISPEPVPGLPDPSSPPEPLQALPAEPAATMQPEPETVLPGIATGAIPDTESLLDRVPETNVPEAPVETGAPDSAVEAEAERLAATAAGNPFIHEPASAEPVPRRPWLAAACILLTATLGAQAVFFYRGELAARHPLARQWLNAACAHAGCAVPLPRETKPVLIEASDLQLVDPARPDRIQLTATLRNHAGHDVAYPALDLVLTNATDHTLARRIFLPADYLGKNRDPRAGLAANAELTVRLTLDTGSLGAAGFRLALLPAPLH